MQKITRTVLVLAALAVSCAALALTLLKREKGDIDRLVNSAGYLLETVYREGFSENKVDYEDPILNMRRVFLTTDLDEKHAEAVMKKLSYLDRKEPGRPIDLYIDTPGGSGGEMLSSFIHSIGSPVNVYALDYCCSAGTVVLASATGRRFAFSTSRIVVHIAFSESCPEDDKTYSPEAQEMYIYGLFWKNFSTLPEEFYSVDEDRYYNLTAAQALEFGIIDEIIEMKGDGG
jgi:ATP-dependent Clp protease protease subunit